MVEVLGQGWAKEPEKEWAPESAGEGWLGTGWLDMGFDGTIVDVGCAADTLLEANLITRPSWTMDFGAALSWPRVMGPGGGSG